MPAVGMQRRNHHLQNGREALIANEQRRLRPLLRAMNVTCNTRVTQAHANEHAVARKTANVEWQASQLDCSSE